MTLINYSTNFTRLMKVECYDWWCKNWGDLYTVDFGNLCPEIDTSNKGMSLLAFSIILLFSNYIIMQYQEFIIQHTKVSKERLITILKYANEISLFLIIGFIIIKVWGL